MGKEAYIDNAGDLRSCNRFGKSRLEWTLNKLLLGAGAGADPTEIDVIGGATKEIFVPVQVNGEDIAILSYQGAKIDGVGDDGWMKLLVPQDFTAITALEVIFLPDETGASMNFAITTNYAAYSGGENWDVHTETASPRNIGATTAYQYKNHSISDLVDVAALAAGDILIVIVTYNATAIDSNANVAGLRLKYS